MSYRSHRLFFGSAVVFALTLLAPVAVTAEDDVAALAPVAAPSVDDTSAGDVRATRALAAQRALQTGDLGSLQEAALLAVVATAPSWEQTSGYGSVEASRATIGHPATSTTSEQPQVLAAQQALLSHDLGSLQEEALTTVTVVTASIATAEASVDDALAATRAELLAQFRAIDRSLSQSLGVEQPATPSCQGIG